MLIVLDGQIGGTSGLLWRCSAIYGSLRLWGLAEVEGMQ